MRRVLMVLAVAALAIAPALAAAPSATTGAGQNTMLYHSYDGLVCGDCHTLHNSEDGAPVTTNGSPNQALLVRPDFTDVCLSCHKQGNNTSATANLPNVANSGWTAPIVMTLDGVDPAGIAMPGGDFYWSNLDPARGHNPAYTEGAVGLAPTSTMMQSDPNLADEPPGGVLDGTTEWSCHSCHGMHSRFSGSYTAWRQVQRKINGHVVTGDVSGFGVETTAGNKTQDPSFEPIKSNSRGDIQGTSYVNTRADGNKLEGADLFADESDSNKNVYRGGFSSFCSACHGDFHGGNGEAEGTNNGNTYTDSWIRHPSNLVMADKNTGGLSSRKYGISTYTAVVTNSQGTNPNPAGYDWRYPLVQPDSDFTVSYDVASMNDATTALANDRLMCLTCHKAHATQFANMTRWDTTGHAFIADGDTDFMGQVSNGDNPAYGCGKCHQKGGTNAYVKSF